MIGLTFRDLTFNSAAFDAAPCAVTTITGGGGNTFDCYADGEYPDTMPLAGTGLSAIYVGNSPLANALGDTFEAYPDGAYSGGTPGASAVGLTEIFVGNGP